MTETRTVSKKPITTNEFASKLANAIKLDFNSEKGALSSYIACFLHTYHITDHTDTREVQIGALAETQE
jgi:hypothetical protein